MSNLSNLTGTKPALQSMGVLGGIGSIVAGGALVVRWLGFDVTPSDVTAVTQHAEAGISAALGVWAAVSGAFAIWGRIRATKKIG